MILHLAALLLAFNPAYEVRRDVVFHTVASRELKMDLFIPKQPIREPMPVVLSIYGGAWVMGRPSDMDPISTRLAEQGVFVAAPQYRLAPAFRWPAMLDDVQTAARYLRANAKQYNIQPERMGAVGVSAGAHLSLLLGSLDTRDPQGPFADQSSRVQAVVSLAAPVDMLNDFPASIEPLVQMVMGKPRSEASEDMRNASPVTFIDAKSAPAFFIHGTADEVVPFAQLDRIVQRYKAAGVAYEAVIVEGASHNPADRPEGVAAVARALDWLVRQITQ